MDCCNHPHRLKSDRAMVAYKTRVPPYLLLLVVLAFALVSFVGFEKMRDMRFANDLIRKKEAEIESLQEDLQDKEKKKFKIDWKRVATTSMFGFGFVGPVGHFWYEGLEHVTNHRLRLRPGSLQFVAAKLAADSLIFGPVHLLAFFTYMGLASGKKSDQVKEDVKRDFLPAFMMEGTAWPLVQTVNFRFVPVRYQLLYVNFFCLLDSAFLSWFEQQEDAPWKRWLKSLLPV